MRNPDGGSDRIAARLLGVIQRHNGALRVDLETELGADLGLDSLGLVELLAAVEDEFQVEFERDDARALRTVGDVVRFLAAAASDGAAA